MTKRLQYYAWFFIWRFLRNPLAIISYPSFIIRVSRNRRTTYRGIRLIDSNFDDSDDDLFLTKTQRALDLIHKRDPLRFNRVRREVKWVVNSELPTLGMYRRPGRVCYVDFGRWNFDEHPEWSLRDLASTIVHEATHGHLHSKYIAHTKAVRIRVERVCWRAEMRFLNHLNDRWADELKRDFDATPWIEYYELGLLEKFDRYHKRVEESQAQSNDAGSANSSNFSRL